MEPIREIQPGKPLRAEDLNIHLRETARQEKVSGDGVHITSSDSGVQINVQAVQGGMWAKVTGSAVITISQGVTEKRYSWIAMGPDLDGRLTVELVEAGSTTNNPAIEVNGFSVPNNAIVWLMPTASSGGQQRWAFFYNGLQSAVTATENSLEVVTDVYATPAGISVGKALFVGSNYDLVVFRSFLGLRDVAETSYLGQAGRAVVVNAQGTGLEFGSVIQVVSPTFLGLGDTPDQYGLPGQVVRINPAGNALIFTDPPFPVVSGSLVLQTGNLSLENDLASVAPNHYYGTAGNNVRGWQSLPDLSILPQILADIIAIKEAIRALGGVI